MGPRQTDLRLRRFPGMFCRYRACHSAQPASQPLPPQAPRRLALGVLSRALVVGAALWSAPAWAIGDKAPIDSERFHPALGTERLLTTDMANVGPHLQLVPQLFLHYADRPLIFTIGGERYADLIKNRVTADLGLSLSLWIKGKPRLQFGLSFPVALYQGGDTINASTVPQDLRGVPLPPSSAVAGQEDLRFQVKAVIWNNDRWGIGAAGDLTVPTGNADSYLGARYPTGTLRLLGHVTYGRVTGTLNVGWLIGSEESVAGTKTGMGLTYGLGAQVEVATYHGEGFKVPFYVVGEAFGLAHSRFDSPAESPLELLFAGKTRYKDWSFLLGAGPGLVRGYGEPRVRVFAGVSWAWEYKEKPKPIVIPPAPVPPPHVPTCEELHNCPEPPPPKKEVRWEKPVLELPSDILFAFDSCKIELKGYERLDEVAGMIKARPDWNTIRVEGHADIVGGDEYNLRLSRCRAHRVVLYLLEHGVESSRLSYLGFGWRCPRVPNDTDENRAKNRRVEFIRDESKNPPRCPVPPQLEPLPRHMEEKINGTPASQANP